MIRTLHWLLQRITALFIYLLRGGAVAARFQGVKIGRGCKIYILNFGSEPFLISIGDNVTITSGVKLITHDGSTALVKNASGSRFQRYGRITIGNNVFIGVNSIILPGVTIGSNIIIGAGSIVTKDVPDDVVIAGSPAVCLMGIEHYENKIRRRCVNEAELISYASYQEKVELIINMAENKVRSE